MAKTYFGRFKVNREPGKGVLWLVLGILFEVCWIVPIAGWIIGLIGGIFFILFAGAKKRRNLFERFLQYGAVVGNRERVPMEELAQARRGNVNGTREEISRIISKGYFGEGAYIDLKEDCLVVPLPEQNANAGWMASIKEALHKMQGSQTFDAPDEQLYKDAGIEEAAEEQGAKSYVEELDRILGELEAINAQIRDPGVKCRINRIGQLTADIFHAVIDKPEREADVRKFMNYYLPTTLKLLKSYELLEDQSFQGENIAASRAKIENVLNMLIGAYEKQLDRLFSDAALDIATDIDVLETMMSGDGLSAQKGITLKL